MYDSPTAAMPQREGTTIERHIVELEQLNRRIGNYAAELGAIADMWHGPLPPPPPNAGKHVEQPTGAGRVGQLEALMRTAHALAQSIENQLDRIRGL